MPVPYSVHAIDESHAPEWLPGEELAAAGFLAMTFLLVLEINIQIHRFFTKRNSVFFWAMQIGSLACAVDALGCMLRYLVPHSENLWPLYTLLATTGWAVYTVAQLTVLYTRLHLVLQQRQIQICVLYMIILVSPALIIADWVTTWASYNPKTSGLWSPAEAIIERICQLGFSAIEIIINIIYVVAVLKILRRRSDVRSRRVLNDLIYVNILAVLLDVLNIALTYVNQIGLSHVVQTFGYAVKLRIEFVVLNQLAIVVGRGLRRETFELKRYLRPSDFGEECLVDQRSRKSSAREHTGCSRSYVNNTVRYGCMPAAVPEPIFLKLDRSPTVSAHWKGNLLSPRAQPGFRSPNWFRDRERF